MKKFDFDPLPLPKHQVVENPQPTTSSTIRMCVDVYSELTEKIKDYAYWEGLTQQEVILQSLEHWLKNKPIKSRPATLKNRPKIGRKRKA